ncbi:MAG TPA: glycoside hydrolase family 57 protein, partial [Chthonomonadaceae bacterium]|nr:glycoside hydrolase family 57 protein [Chthonomonadaceae bacterium]
ARKEVRPLTLVTFFFFAHQPVRLRPYELRRQGEPLAPEQLADHYFDEELNRTVFRKVAQKCYYPATRLLLDLVRQHRDSDKPFRLAYGLSGTFLEQAQRYEPALLDLFQQMAATGEVEFTGETYYHSLSSLFGEDRREFCAQVEQHAAEIERLFGRRPTVFRNTECLYNNSIASTVQGLGYEGIITEGVDWLMEGWRSPDFLYTAPCGLPVLLRNYRLSDDIGYRFPNRSWENWPLTAETFAGWLARNTDMNVTLALDYEALGEHIWADTGIFDFLRALPDAIKRHPQLEFTTPTQAIRRLPRMGTLFVDDFATISWADKERDTSAWLGNEMQQFAFEEIKRLEPLLNAVGNPHLLHAWRLMQTSDHLYYLSDKALSDGDVHKYFSAYGSLFEGFIRLHTALSDLQRQADRLLHATPSE